MKLFVDIQFMQTGAFGRGMGQHVRGLFKSALKQIPKDITEVIFIYSENLDAANVSELEAEFKAVRPRVPITFAQLATIEHSLDEPGGYDVAYERNLAACTAFYNERATGDDVWFIPCPMQEPVVPVVPNVDGLKTTVLWYDLMPYLMHDHYFPDSTTPFAHSYLSRMNLLLDYDHILTISDTSCNDLVRYLALAPEDITNTGGWVNTEIAGEGTLPSSITQPYLLLNASPEPNKNALRAIEAFHVFNRKHGDAYQLVVTSDYNPKMGDYAKEIGANVNFVGHISSSDLKEVYLQSEALLFVSLYEGLGLPPLEAVNFDKKVILSDTPVHREFGGDNAFYWCDPYNTASIAQAIEECISKGAALSSEQAVIYKAIKGKYSWDISATRMWDAIMSLQKRKIEDKRIAVVGPHPSSFSSIGKFVAETYPAMRRYGSVDYYYDKGPSDRRHGKIRFNYLEASPYLKPIHELVHATQPYDKVVYHMGNSDHHMVTYLQAHAKPGVLVLHDTNLGGDGLSGQMLSNGYISKERYDIEHTLEATYLKQPERFITSLVSSQDEVVVHSGYACDVVRNYLLTDKPHIVQREHPLRAVRYTREKEFEGRPLRLGIAGIMTEVKGVNTIDWIMNETDGLAGAELYVFGFGFFADKKTLKDLEAKYQNVHVAFDLSDLEFNAAMAQLDVLVNYREVYKGEASRATLEALRERVVPIVRNVGWFGEMPDSVTYKLEAVEEIPGLIKDLVRDRSVLPKMVNAGQELLRDKFGPEDYMKGILDA